ncbi:NAD-dependent epimerase/dehydratase family protein [Desulfocurvibacter africanus]|uniref:NAD-dependent epimerase/dehydratase family protein n=1 Tax=Desulfocurvibacter africanus TaxID=873 RepID=UPI0003F74B5D|nr:NAD-dependent epimerase/dehydratase family protein [Desulfocurvibacter africanus]
MKTAVVTGSGGLIGSETVRRCAKEGFLVLGIDNDMRSYFFGDQASTRWLSDSLQEQYENFIPHKLDIRDYAKLEKLLREHAVDIELIVHCAAQPSHDWAAREPLTDFSVNANGTLNLLEFTRQYAPRATFIFTSTNKVYGDLPNTLPLIETATRWEVQPDHPYAEQGVDESMPIDKCKHSVFGASKVAADIMVQEYGRYFDMNTVCFRGGCLTGPDHSGAQLHGFLSYLAKCVLTGTEYTVFGYKGKQVRDNIHSKDLVDCFMHYHKNPRPAEVYNIGGSRHSNCSVLEAIGICEEMTGKRMKYSIDNANRSGDHIWWISDVSRFRSHYPEWNYTHDVKSIIGEIMAGLDKRLGGKPC